MQSDSLHVEMIQNYKRKLLSKTQQKKLVLTEKPVKKRSYIFFLTAIFFFFQPFVFCVYQDFSTTFYVQKEYLTTKCVSE